ncbi:MAG: hypothetical protein ACI85K_003248, partial [Hyphomicrobiaceae bacterium]
MCGIVGIRRFDGKPVDEQLLRQMAAQLHHRGPDGDGFRVIGGDVGFGHTRLSIIDLAGSPQPMTSANGPFHVTFNGEIFNYLLALVPRPRKHLVTYHGVLAPAASLRSRIVPRPDDGGEEAVDG